MKTAVRAIALCAFGLAVFSSSAWAVTQYNYQWMYCPAGTKHYGMRVLRDIRYCDRILRGQHLFLNTKTKTKSKR